MAEENNITPNQDNSEQTPKRIVCVRCMALFDENLEFCPECKSPALWSKETFIQKRKAAGLSEVMNTSGYKYYARHSDYNPKKARTKSNIARPFLLIIVACAIFLMIYSFNENKKINTLDEVQAAAIEIVKQSNVIDATKSVGEVFDELAQEGANISRVLGWDAQMLEPNIYMVSFRVDNDLANTNGVQAYRFEVDISTGQVQYLTANTDNKQ